MSIFKSPRIKKGVNYLELTPVRKYEHEVKDDGLVKVLIPKFKNKFMLSFVPKHKSPFIKVSLDELGSGVWLAIDGYKHVDAIIEDLNVKFGDKIQPAEERITKFLTNLYENKFIIFNELNKQKNG
jgi:hypothetical protein